MVEYLCGVHFGRDYRLATDSCQMYCTFFLKLKITLYDCLCSCHAYSLCSRTFPTEKSFMMCPVNSTWSLSAHADFNGRQKYHTSCLLHKSYWEARNTQCMWQTQQTWSQSSQMLTLNRVESKKFEWLSKICIKKSNFRSHGQWHNPVTPPEGQKIKGVLNYIVSSRASRAEKQVLLECETSPVVAHKLILGLQLMVL